jgi:flagellar motor protein MotB
VKRPPLFKSSIEFLANPYVVLVDLLIATFFVLVLYVHSAHLENLAGMDPRVAQIRQFQHDLAGNVRGYWGEELQDEARSAPAPGETAEAAAQRWWTHLPSNTAVILKQDASFLKLILMGSSENTALFRRGTSELTPHGRQAFARLARCLGESAPAYELAKNRAILSITIEGHTAAEGWQSSVASWDVSIRRALQVQQILEREGARHDRARLRIDPDSAPLFSAGRFSVVGRGHYQRLPFSAADSPANRRVQIEIRFTERFASPTN